MKSLLHDYLYTVLYLLNKEKHCKEKIIQNLKTQYNFNKKFSQRIGPQGQNAKKKCSSLFVINMGNKNCVAFRRQN